MWRFWILWLVCRCVFAAPLIDLNTATAQELAEGLVGIGLKKAEAIVAYRTQVGQILTIEELLVVKGIGEKTLARNRDRIRTVLMDGESKRLVSSVAGAEGSTP